MRQTFTTMTFNVWSASLVLALQIINQLVWSYLDLFVALFAMGLSAFFQQINSDIDATLVKVSYRISMAYGIPLARKMVETRIRFPPHS